MTLSQGQEMTTIIKNLVVIIYQLSYHRQQKFLKNPLLSILSYIKA